MKIFYALLVAITTIFVGVACSKSSTASIGAPKVKPPVEAVIPEGLLGGRSSHRDGTLIDAIQERLFSDGPTEILNILDNVDSRMAEIDSRTAESARPCITATPVDKTADFTFPGTVTTFPHYLQCHDVFSGSTGWMGFGKKSDIWYLREGNNSGIGSVVNIDADENVHGYFILGTENLDGSTMLFHFKTNKADETIEFTAGGVGIGFCQVHFKSSPEYIYVVGQRDGVGNACESIEEACLNAADKTEAASASLCNDLKGANLELETLGRKASGSISASSEDNVELTTLFDMGKIEITGVESF